MQNILKDYVLFLFKPTLINKHYFKLPYTGWFSSHTQKCVNYLVTNVLCNNTEIVLALLSHKIGSLLNLKDPIPNGLRSVMLCTNFVVQAVMSVTSERRLTITTRE